MSNRIYKNKKEKNNNFIIDDRHELLNIYKSKCLNCKYFEEWDFYCQAFPKGIPDEYLSGDKFHTENDKDQVGDTVFIERT
jgi:hypothetical protein